MKTLLSIWILFVFIIALSIFNFKAEAAVTMEPVWTHSSPSWVAEDVSLGNYGNETFVSLGSAVLKNSVFSVFDHNPPNPVMEHEPQTDIFTRLPDVDSAGNINRHIVFRWFQNPDHVLWTPILKKYNSNGGLEWSYSFPVQSSDPNDAVRPWNHVSGNGITIVGAVYNFAAAKTDFAVFSDNSGVPGAYNSVDTFGPAKLMSFSADGSLAHVRTQNKISVIDTMTGQIIYYDFDTGAYYGGSDLSEDGNVFADSTTGSSDTKIEVYKWNGQTYNLSFSYDLPNSTRCGRLGLSPDGNFLAAVCFSGSPALRMDILAFDLISETLVLSDSTMGAGQYQNTPSGISISNDASAFAVSSWGDELGQAPDLIVYTKNGSNWSRYGEFTHPGSAFAAEIYAKNGIGTVALASKAIHANEFGGGGRIDLFNIGNGLILEGVPYQNQEVDFEFEAQAGTVLLSTGLAPTPNLIPGIGWLYLDPSNLIILPPAQADQNGVVTIPYTFTQSPGTSLYAQAIQLSPNRRFLNHFIKATVY